MYITMRRENEVGLQQTRMKLRRHEKKSERRGNGKACMGDIPLPSAGCI